MYEIKLNGLLMDLKPTMKGALALVTTKFHMRTGVTIGRKGEILWKS